MGENSTLGGIAMGSMPGRTIPNGIGPVRESEMSRVSGRLHGSIEALTNNLVDLEQRLNPVLGNDVPRNDSAKAVNPEFSSIIAKDISIAVTKIENLIGLVQSIKQRVEV